MTARAERILRLARLATLAAAAVLTVVGIVALAGGGEREAELTDLIARASGGPSSRPAGGPAASERDERVKRVAKRDLFSPPKEDKFEGRLLGVLGDAAIFAPDNLVKVGQEVSGAKLTEIGPDWVMLEHKGKPLKLSVFDGGGGGGGGPPGGPPMMMRPPGMSGRVMTIRPSPSARPGPMEVTPRMIEQFRRLSPEQREQALRHMPPELRAKLEKGS